MSEQSEKLRTIEIDPNKYFCNCESLEHIGPDPEYNPPYGYAKFNNCPHCGHVLAVNKDMICESIKNAEEYLESVKEDMEKDGDEYIEDEYEEYEELLYFNELADRVIEKYKDNR